MKRILLMGNPNVGKSVVFSRLTGANVVASNYPGTTVDFTRGKMRIEGEKWEVIDVPGTYSLDPTSPAEEVATQMVEEGDLIINVVDSTNLERNLYLTFELLERDIPVIVVLNLWDEAKLKGIKIDVDELEKELGVPVVPVVALTGEGIKELVSKITKAKTRELEEKSEDERWAQVGQIVKQIQKIKHRHPTLKEKISKATIKPLTGIPIALVVIYLTFTLIRFIGEWLIGNVTEPFFANIYIHFPMWVSKLLGGSGILHEILIGKLFNGEIEWMESMGLLTTGVFVPFAAVLPYIIAFYLGLTLLEDSGYLPRLATLVDNVFHKLGMHGHGIVPVFLGFGCNVPGALSTRTLETRKQRFISATLLSIAVPCMAQIAMVFGVLGTYGMGYISVVFGTLLIIYLVAGLILNRIISGESPEIFLEIPPYRRPSLEAVVKKTLMRVKWFIKEAIPWLFGGIILVNIFYAFGILQWVGDLAAPVIVGLFGLPKEAVAALLIGFLRKDLAVGMLLGLGMSPLQLTIAATILVIYFPCAATFATLFKEMGVKDLLKSVSIMLVTVLIVGFLMRVILL